ncbi:hypothetical protein OY671_008082, partial [Metschnikowia pulcherrima]
SKQTIVVENKAGAGGSLGMEQVARSTADGYTIGMATMSTHGSNPAVYRKMNYDPLKDFEPVANVSAVPSIFAINPQIPARNMAEFVASAKGQADKYSFASPGVGSSGHVNIENFMMSAGIKSSHVPYRGTGPALNDVIAGQVPISWDTAASSMAHIQSGSSRAIVVAARKRSPQSPDVPTFAEVGSPTYDAEMWNGSSAPAGSPAPISAKSGEASRRARADPEARAKYAGVGA